MPHSATTAYPDIALLGMLAGARSMSAPVFVTEYLRRHVPAAPLRHPYHLLASPRVAALFKLAAVGELIADKLPVTPDRIRPGPLGGRAVWGAFAGVLVAVVEDAPPLAGALLGAGTAVAGAYAAYGARRWLAQRLPVPDPLVGAAEDALVYYTGLRWLRSRTAALSI